MSDDRCDIDDCKVRLYQYAIVSLRRGDEELLKTGYELVVDPMDECAFDNWVIAQYVRKHPVHSTRWLRVCSQILCTWDKQPLHYQEKQLDYLRSIAHSVRKIGGPEDDDDRAGRPATEAAAGA